MTIKNINVFGYEMEVAVSDIGWKLLSACIGEHCVDEEELEAISVEFAVEIEEEIYGDL
jgi:hypothetical protein